MKQLMDYNTYLDHLNSLPRINDLEYQYRSVSLFSGVGGLDLGLAFAGFETKFSTDIEPVHCNTISYNFPNCATLQTDAIILTGQQIIRLIGSADVDLVAGGPPCQAFSILGQRNSFSDPRGRLVYEFVRLVKEIQPKAFIFENVPGIITLNGGIEYGREKRNCRRPQISILCTERRV